MLFEHISSRIRIGLQGCVVMTKFRKKHIFISPRIQNLLLVSSGLVSMWLVYVGCYVVCLGCVTAFLSPFLYSLFILTYFRCWIWLWCNLKKWYVELLSQIWQGIMYVLPIKLRSDVSLFLHWSFCWVAQCKFGGSLGMEFRIPLDFSGWSSFLGLEEIFLYISFGTQYN